MAPKKILFMVLLLLLFSAPSFADGHIRAEAGPVNKIFYVETVNAITRDIHVKVDVTNRIPHEVQVVSNSTVLIIN